MLRTLFIIIKEKIRSVQTSSNDLTYTTKSRGLDKRIAKLIEEPCKDAWKGEQLLVNVLKELYKGLAVKAHEESQKSITASNIVHQKYRIKC
jgi:hypothetical protein